MKFNFKKVAAVTASVVIGVSFAGTASAVQYPDNWSSSNVAVVYGNDLDSAIATNINEDIDDSISFESSGSSAGSGIGEDNVAIGDVSGDLNLGDKFGVTLYEDDLDVLADGSVNNDEDYTQELKIVDSNDIQFDALDDEDNYVAHSDYAEDVRPVLFVDQENPLWEYTLEFDDELDATEDEEGGEEIVIAGKEWTIAPDLAADDDLTLYSAAVTPNLEYRESQTVEVGEEEYEIEITHADPEADDNTITLSIDGESESGLTEGSTMSVGDDDFYINSLTVDTVQDTAEVSAEIFAGADELVLTESNSEVELNEETMDSVKGDYTASNDLTDIETINLEFTPSEIEYDAEYVDHLDEPEYAEYSYLEITESITDPVLGSISFGFDSGTLEYEDEDEDFTNPEEIKDYSESIKMEVSGDDQVQMSFTNRKGDTYNPTIVEEDDTDFLSETDDFANLSRSDRRDTDFVLNIEGSDEDNTHIAQIDAVNLDDNDDVESVEITYDGDTKEYDIGDEIRRSSDSLMVCTGLDPTNTYAEDTTTFSLQEGSCIVDGDTNLYDGGLDSIYAANDVVIDIDSVVDQAATDVAEMSEDITITEDKGGDAESSLTVTVDETENDASDPEYEVSYSDASQDDEGEYGYDLTNYGSYIETEEDDSEWFEMYTPEEEQVTYNLLVGATAEASEDDSSDGEAGTKAISADEGYSDNDVVIAVGGSCINSAAAEALGVSEETCGSDFTDATGVGSGEFLIQKVSDAYDSGATAIVVAGYEASDTEAAGNTFIDEDVELSEDGQVYETATKEVVTAE